MKRFKVTDLESAKEFSSYIKDDKPEYTIEGNMVYVKSGEFKGSVVEISEEYKTRLNDLFNVVDDNSKIDELIFGKNELKGIIAFEVVDSQIIIKTNKDEIITYDYKYWLLAPRKYNSNFKLLKGNQHYKYIAEFNSKEEFNKQANILKKQRKDIYTIWNPEEAAMVRHGFTFYSGLQIDEVSVLSFDIESNGLTRNKDSKVFVITNTFRDRDGVLINKQFILDDYNDDQFELIDAWCEWVKEVDPDILTGHNINGYDLPFLQHCYGHALSLGRGSTPDVVVGKRNSKKRVDGALTWEYKKVKCFGRQIVDGIFLSVMFDVFRKYPSWGLKSIAEYEGWVTEDRQFYDAATIKDNWYDPVEKQKIIDYCKDDSDDSLRVFDLMAPAYFYLCQYIPRPFQLLTESASGGWLNSLMVRSYLQQGYSIPKKSEYSKVAGGMSWGNPGIYKNVVKWDAKSFYPNTILTFNIYDKDKDPEANYHEMVKYFTNRRFEQKDKFKETGNKYYDNMQESSKILINSSYGLLATNGLNFNNFHKAAEITQCCRKSLQKTILWATGKDTLDWWEEYTESNGYEQDFKDYKHIDSKCKVNVDQMPRHDWILANIDTDAISFAKKDGSSWSKEEENSIKKELNDIMYSEWEDDGSFDKVVILKAKNYILLTKGEAKYKKKGSSINDKKKEPALLEMIDFYIDDLMKNNGKNLVEIYNSYIKEVKDIEDISRWAMKKNITSSVLKPTRTQEEKVLKALEGKEFSEGDKIWLFSDIDGEVQAQAKGEPLTFKDGRPKMVTNEILRCVEDFEGSYNLTHYIKRVFKTNDIFSNLLDKSLFLDYNLKKNKELLNGI